MFGRMTIIYLTVYQIKNYLDNANKFIEAATKDIKKSAELNNTISTTLKNLFLL